MFSVQMTVYNPNDYPIVDSDGTGSL